MTIKQFAEEQGISTQAVYKKIKERKLNVNQLKDEEGKELSQEGIGILANLFGNERKKVEEKNNDFQPKIQHLEEENAILKAELEKVKALLQMKDSMIDMLKSQLDYMQRLQALTLQRIPDQRPTLWQRLTGKTGKKAEENAVK